MQDIPDSQRTFKNTLLPLDDLYNIISKIWGPIELLASVSESEKIREACYDSSIKFSSYLIKLSFSKKLMTES